MRAVYVTFIATLVLAAGCGSSEVGAVDGASPAAELKPGALVYLETDSDQWKQAEELLGRFPDGDRWIAELRQKIAKEGVDWEEDVEPALGRTTAFAVYSGGGEPQVVALTNSDDPDKTVALVKKLDRRSGGSPTVTRVVGDWVVISESEAAIDSALQTGSGGSLADDEGFKAAMAKMPDDALARLYADPAAALDAFGSTNQSQLQALRMLGLDRLDFAGAWAKARDDGAELALVAGGEGAPQLLGTGEAYASALLERVPADALAFASFEGRGAKNQIEELKTNPLYAMALRQFEREVGVKVEDLVSLADGEIAFYARMTLPFPELTLMLDSANAERARADAEKLLRALAQREGGRVTEDGDVTTAVIDELTVYLGSVDGIVVFTTSKDAFAELAASGDKLPDSDRWRSAREAAGVPDEYTSLAWVDLTEAVPLLQAYLELTGSPEQLPPDTARNLEALKTLVAWGTLEGDVAEARAFLEID